MTESKTVANKRYRGIFSGHRIDPDLWTKFKLMVQDYSEEISSNAAINMLIRDAVKRYALPGFHQKAAPEWEMEKRNDEKFGEVPMLPRGEIVGPAQRPRKTPAPSPKGIESKQAG